MYPAPPPCSGLHESRPSLPPPSPLPLEFSVKPNPNGAGGDETKPNGVGGGDETRRLTSASDVLLSFRFK